MSIPASTRFAPSPTGYLHLGHAYSAWQVWLAAGQNPEHFHLRIDDLDHTRCKPEFEQAIIEDLTWLGVSWSHPVIRQSERLQRYRDALDMLVDRGFAYACFLSRREHHTLLSAPHHPPQFIPSSRHLISDKERHERLAAGEQAVWRLDIAAVLDAYPEIFWTEISGRQHLVTAQDCGDVIIGRRDIPASYHLSVVLDDADTDIEIIVRGEDLLHSTPIHAALQAALGLPAPRYSHHRLITDEQGKRLAKRHDALAIAQYRANGVTPSDLLARCGNLPSQNHTLL